MTKSRKNLLVILSICFILCFATFFVTANHTAKADTTGTVNVETILMNDGASVRLKNPNDEDYGDYAGIRFRLYVNKEYYTTLGSPEVGMYITLYDETSESDMCNINSIPENAMFFRAEAFAGDDAETIQETMSFNAVIYDIPVDQYGTKLIANGYIMTDSGEVFATNPQTRSLAQTASINIAKGEDADALKDYVDAVVNEDNFKFTNTAIETDLYKTEEPNLGVVVPEDLTVIYQSSDEDVITVDENGNLKRAGKVGSATITATLGTNEITATVTVNEPAVVKVSQATSSLITLDNVVNSNAVYRSASNLSGLSGDYEGNAVDYYVTNAYRNRYVVTNVYSETELQEIKKDYNSVSMWICYDLTASDTANEANVRHPAGGTYGSDKLSVSFMEKAGKLTTISTTSETNKKWQKITISIDDYLSILSENNYEYFVLFGLVVTNINPSSSSIYIGDITFELVISSEIIKITESNYKKFNYNGNTTETYIKYVAQGSAELEAISGDYQGNAIKYKPVGAFNGQYRITNSFSESDFATIKKVYNSVSLWWAYSLTKTADSHYINFLPESSGGKSFLLTSGLSGTKTNSSSTHLVWQKVTISIDQYMALLDDRDYSYCVLFGLGGPVGIDNASSGIYFGDIFFENI